MLKLEAETVNAFIEPCISVFEMLTPKVGRMVVGAVYVEAMKVSNYDVSMSCMISGSLEGKVVLSMKSDVALEIAEDMVGEAVDSLDDDAQSAIKELMTMVVGNAAVELGKTNLDINIAPVTFSYGFQEHIGNPSCPYPVTVPLLCDLGTVEIDLAFY